MRIKLFKLNYTLGFGKYSGKTVEEISKIDPHYLDWSLCYLDHFYLDSEQFEKIQALVPTYQFSENAIDKREEKDDDFHCPETNRQYEDDEYYGLSDSDVYRDGGDGSEWFDPTLFW